MSETKWHLDTLPEAQRKILPRLADIPPSFVLYGGTALALRLEMATEIITAIC